MSSRPALAILVLVSILPSCSDSTSAVRGRPAVLAIAAGDAQRGVAGEALAESLSVRVLDEGGAPVADKDVRWTVLRGGGAMRPATSRTGADGRARSAWTLGPRADSAQTASAAVDGLAPVAFQATPVPGSATRIGITPDSATLSALHDTVRLAARIEDAHGNPLPAAPVAWSTPASSGVDVDSGGTVVARANGRAVIIATSGTLTDTAIVIVRQVAAAVHIDAESSLRVSIGESLPLVAAVLDARGFPIAGAPVSWGASPTGVATVDEGGRVAARCVGEASVVARSGAVSQGATVRVPPQVAYLNVRDDGSGAVVVLVDDDGSRPLVLTTSAFWSRFHSPTWMPDARHVTVSAGSLNLASTTFSTVGMDGASTVLFSRPGNTTTLAWSPSGDALAFESPLFFQQNPRNLYSWNPATGAFTRLTSDETVWDEAPAWSPDGRTIAFQRRAASGTDWELYLVDRWGGNVRLLATGLAGSAQPDWSPDGSMIAFVSGYTGTGSPTGLYTIRPDASGLRHLSGGDGATNPAWSPDGTRIAFTRGASQALVVINADGSGATEIASGASQPAWRPRCIAP